MKVPTCMSSTNSPMKFSRNSLEKQRESSMMIWCWVTCCCSRLEPTPATFQPSHPTLLLGLRPYCAVAELKWRSLARKFAARLIVYDNDKKSKVYRNCLLFFWLGIDWGCISNRPLCWEFWGPWCSRITSTCMQKLRNTTTKCISSLFKLWNSNVSWNAVSTIRI